MVYAINTGLLTSICASAAVIAVSTASYAIVCLSHKPHLQNKFATMPTNFVWLSFFWCLGKRKRLSHLRLIWLPTVVQFTSIHCSRRKTPVPFLPNSILNSFLPF